MASVEKLVTNPVEQNLQSPSGIPDVGKEPTFEMRLNPIIRPRMFLVDEMYEPINEVDSDVQDEDDRGGSVDADDVTEPDDTDELTTGSTLSTSVILDKETSDPSEPSTEASDPYDSEEETEPPNFSDRQDDDSEDSFTDESDFETSEMSSDTDNNTTVGTDTDYDLEQIQTLTVGEGLEEQERRSNDVWRRVQGGVSASKTTFPTADSKHNNEWRSPVKVLFTKGLNLCSKDFSVGSNPRYMYSPLFTNTRFNDVLNSGVGRLQRMRTLN